MNNVTLAVEADHACFVIKQAWTPPKVVDLGLYHTDSMNVIKVDCDPGDTDWRVRNINVLTGQ